MVGAIGELVNPKSARLAGRIDRLNLRNGLSDRRQSPTMDHRIPTFTAAGETSHSSGAINHA
jgi:hypothetical protein